ncbi:hypothetical protein G7K_1029-t1 [Saitoella complicata NRRL Y-17804]|uniref:Dolichyl-diphosphooligosaccharide-protein glycosyltransferase subunit OST5 n=1 Tax=Saitoella complicata (strain BCRC 22490 / CBS 7301 / JCM 7358 / NBRC 10748 / NRRL Y-17804) TaxID=698492 RepID=A0A0E9NAR6_SAICN|nr:hypothetical protein G7K_1029-t1 [Saitoella complicata NRRL Y-17804]
MNYEQANAIWESATPYVPSISIDQHSTVAATCLVLALSLLGFSTTSISSPIVRTASALISPLFFGFGALYLLLAAGVYV